MARKVTRRAFVQDGNPYTKSWFSQAQIAEGGKIVLRMGAQPNEKSGAAGEDRPPSFA